MQNKSRWLRSSLAALALAAAPACEDPLEPEELAGSYALVMVQSDPLPTELYTNEYVTVRVLADTLHLMASGVGAQTGLRQSDLLIAPDSIRTVRVETPLRFRTVDRRIEIEYVCPPDANCAPPPHLAGTPTSSGLLIDSTFGLGRVPLLYERLPSAPGK